MSHQRSRLIIVTCLGLSGAILFIVLFWVLSGSLEDWETLVAGAIVILNLMGIAELAHRQRVAPAAWGLIGLLMLLITADLAEYGLVTITAAAYVIPVILAAFCLGSRPAIAVASLGAAAGWVIAWLKVSGQPQADISQLTFAAPVLTVILLVTAAMVGYWARATQEPR